MFWKILLTFLVFGSVDATGVFKLSLTRLPSYHEKAYERVRLGALQNLRLKTLKQPNTRGGGHLASQPLFDYSFTYIANITVGTPQQEFRVLIDTAVTDFWIPDTTCTSISCKCKRFDCIQKIFFDSSKSSTYKKDGSPFSEYDDLFSGFLGVDIVGLGPAGSGKSQLVVPSVTFGQITKAGLPYESFPYDGVLGLAFPKLSSDGAKPVFQEAVDQGLVDKPIFTIWLENEPIGTKKPSGGQLTWGGLDTDNCDSSIMYTPLTSEDYWTFQVDSVTIGSTKRSASWSAITDSSTIITIVPKNVMDDLVTETNATYSFEYGLYRVDCGIKFKWSAAINGQVLNIDESTGIWKIVDGSCFLAFEYTPTGFDFVFGNPLLKQYCSIYDIKNGQIGFAKAKE